MGDNAGATLSVSRVGSRVLGRESVKIKTIFGILEK